MVVNCGSQEVLIIEWTSGVAKKHASADYADFTDQDGAFTEVRYPAMRSSKKLICVIGVICG